jgi:DMSO reductase anchor subunit
VKPALSVILFTVSSGAGLGLVVWLAIAQLAGRVAGGSTPWWAGVGLAALLLTGGLLSSTAHLANPRNGWRSLARVRSSWLSREALSALLLYPLAALHVALTLAGSPAAALSAGLLIVLALLTVVCTAMIYACLKTVPRWRTWHTPAVFVLYALAGGGLLWSALLASVPAAGATPAAAGPSGSALATLLVLAALVKVGYFAKFSARVSATLNDALAVPLAAPAGHVQGRVRLLDVGHAHPTFLTDEFGFDLPRPRAVRLRAAMLLLTAVAPLALLWFGAAGVWLAAVAFLVGSGLERWLFFAQAQHVVRLYHGQPQV